MSAPIWGGTINLFESELIIERTSIVYDVLGFFGFRAKIKSTYIPIERIAAIDIVYPLLLPSFLTISYPGSPPGTGIYRKDLFRENTAILRLTSNIKLHRFIEFLYIKVSEIDSKKGK